MGGARAWARSEWRRRWRELVALSVLLGVLGAASLTCLAGARRSATSYQRLRRAELARDIGLQAGSSGRPLLEHVLQLPDVRSGAIASGYPAFTDIRSDFDLGILAPVDGRYGHDIERPLVLQGRVPKANRADEVALNPTARKQLHARVGGTITVNTLTPAQIAVIEQEFSGTAEGPRLRLHVTGIVRSPDDFTGDVATATLYATPAFESAYAGRVGRYGSLAGVRLRRGSAGAAAFEDEVHKLAGDQQIDLTRSAQVGKEITQSVRVLGAALALIGLVLLLAGVVAGGQALGRQVWAGAHDQPVLAAVGMTRRQRVLASLVVAAPVALGAAAVAAVGAVLASPLMPVNLARQAEHHRGISFDALVLGPGAAAVLALVIVGTALSAWRLARVALRPDEVVARPSRTTAVALRLGSGPATVTGVHMALDRGRGRRAVPVRPALVGAAVGVAGLVAAFTFGASLDRLERTPVRYGAAWDIRPDLRQVDVERAATVREVGDAAIVHFFSVRLGGRPAQGYSLLALKGKPHFTVLSGRMPRSPAEVALGPDQLRRLGVGLGDRVPFEVGDGRPRLRVVGKILVPGMNDDPVPAGVVVTTQGQERVAVGDASDQAVFNWAAGVDPAVAERRFQTQFPGALGAYSRPRPPGNVVNLGRVAALPRALGVLLVLIALAATAHALVTVVRRRRSDLAILRTLGFVRGQVSAAVAWQSTTLAVIGLLVGLPLGLVAGRWTWMLVADGAGVAPDPVVPVWIFLVVPGALVAANLLAALPGLAAARVRPAAVLRTE